jgi:aminopeptidase N
MDDSTSKNKFEFPGSKPHYLPVLPFTIDHMLLKLRPDFESTPKKLMNCEQQLTITARRDIDQIELDSAEIRIESISAEVPKNSNIEDQNKTKYNEKKVKWQESEDKLIIKLGRVLPKDHNMILTIVYSAGFNSRSGGNEIRDPRSGFNFVENFENSPEKNLQAWTQGETIESRYWFPCLDQPQVKFPREIHITVPMDYVVISNGHQTSEPQLEEKSGSQRKKEYTWKWIESTSNPAYLTAVVIGTFAERKGKCDEVPLQYCWPTDVPENHAMLTFSSTPRIMKFFENYLNTKYPYSKYSQVAVDDFQFGGMENTSCTILTRRILHDEKASLDYKRDIDVVSHELAHQWFGDLVTCKDWEHIWLNEGFASYCEALYIEHINNTISKESSQNNDEFQYKIMQTADGYFDEASNLYKRAVVTNVYKHPDDVFDSHAYEKGGCILHMLRYYIGEDNFRKSLEKYLGTYSHSIAETHDLREILQEVSGKNLGLFFDQWLYRAGHPELEIELSIQNSEKAQIRIIQTQEGDKAFEFPLDVELVYSTSNKGKQELCKVNRTLSVSKLDETFEITTDKKYLEHLQWISLDPEFKILKEIKSIKIPKEMIINQLREGRTIIERIQAARALSDKYSDDVITALRDSILTDNFYGVSVEAADILGSYNDKNDHIKTRKAYEALISCSPFQLKIKSPQIRRAVIRNLGGFEKQESLDQLKQSLNDESYFVEQAAATAIGKSAKRAPDHVREEVISLLKEKAKTTNTFQNVLARGAIDGLKEYSSDANEEIVEGIANFLIDMSNSYHTLIRNSATSALAKFLRMKDEKISQKVFEQLMTRSLRDRMKMVKISACQAFYDPSAFGDLTKPDDRILKTMEELTSIAEHDIDGWVRREAEVSINKIREWIKDWAEKPPEIAMKIREEKKARDEKAREAMQRRLLKAE